MSVLWCGVALLISVDVVLAVWRYSNNMESRIAINTRNTLRLEYEGDSLLQWIVPEPCTVSSLTSPSVTLSCPVRGMYTIYPRVLNQTIEDAPRTFNLGAALFNFIWYMVRVPESFASDDEEYFDDENANIIQKDVLRIWILDPEKASSAELNNKAEVPSLSSRVLTKEFHNLGQDLVLHSYPIAHLYNTMFNPAEGYWTAIIYNVTTEIILTISGKPITFQDLFIMDTSYTIEKRLDLSVIKALGYLSLKLAKGRNPLIVYHPCSASSALLLTDFGTFISHDGFITVEELKIVPTEIQHQEQNKVMTAAFLERNILFLIGNSLYIRYAKGFYAKLGAENNLPEEDIIGLLSRMSCATAYPVKGGGTLSSAAVWTNSSLYLLSSKEATYTKHLRIPDWSSVLLTIKTDTVKVSTVSYGSRPPEVGVLMEATDINDKRRLFLTIYNEETETWVLSSLFLHATSDYLPAGPLHMHFIVSALPAVFIWNNNSVHYSLRNNSLRGKLHVNGVEDLSKAMEGSSIHQIVFDHKLNILIKMVNNLILFGVVGTNALVKLHVWERKDSKIILYSNLLSKFFVIKLVNSVVHENTYPLQMEVFSSLLTVKTPECPFRKFDHTLKRPLYYLDMRQTLHFRAEVVYLEEMGLHIHLIDYNKDLLYSETGSQYKITPSFYTKLEHIELYHVKDYRNSKNYTAELEATSGVLSLEFQVNHIEYTCDFSAMRVAHVSVGCPPNKYIAIERPLLSDCQFDDKKKITIPRSVLSEPSAKDREYIYDIKKYGCPIQVHYKSPFKPYIDLYSGLKYLGIVDANYIIWEEHGRTDFYYNATMKQAGCLREAQTWKAMLELYYGDYKHRDSIWGPENYRSCYETPGLIRDMDRPYEILNLSNNVFITWPTDHTGVYLFTVKILDPNYRMWISFPRSFTSNCNWMRRQLGVNHISSTRAKHVPHWESCVFPSHIDKCSSSVTTVTSFCKLTAHFAVETYGVLKRKDTTIVVSVVWSFIFILLCSFGYSYYKYMNIFGEMLYFNKNQSYS